MMAMTGAAGHGSGSECNIGDARGKQTNRVERPGEAFHADRRQQPVRGLEADDAAIGGGPDHRASGLAAERERQHAGRHRSGGTRR
jgi:hypothetical protein